MMGGGHRVRIRWRYAVAGAAVAGALATPVVHADFRTPPAARPSVVVAVADTGVNPYHRAFYRPKNTRHPCTWVKGFTDCSIPALNLTLGKHKDVASAFAADRAQWAAVRQHQWYWIPRTNIIGAVCDTAVGGGATETAAPRRGPSACILDEHGHGTGTASAVLSESPDALLLVHEGNSGANDMPTAPVRPDIQSHSWGFPVPLPLQAARPVRADPCPAGSSGPETLVFLAAGNESPMPALLDCYRSQPGIQVVGGGYPGYWLANSWITYDFASWYCRPTASHVTTTGPEDRCGTSFSAPTAAGAAAGALLRIRRADRYDGRSTAGRVSPSVPREQFVRALRDGASYSPSAKFPQHVPCHAPGTGCFGIRSLGAMPLPKEAPHLFWGYGWLDSTVSDTIASCALRGPCPGKPAAARSYNEQREQARTMTGLHVLIPRHDDAGSGRDAGEDAKTALPVVPRLTYSGRLELNGLDWGDGYRFRARAGQQLTLTTSASAHPTAPALADLGCWSVFGPDGRRVTATGTANVLSCDPLVGAVPPDGLRLPATGTYVAVYGSQVPHDYRFSVRIDP